MTAASTLWLTGNRPGQLFRARQAVDGTPSALVNEAGSLANVVFVDILGDRIRPACGDG